MGIDKNGSGARISRKGMAPHAGIGMLTHASLLQVILADKNKKPQPKHLVTRVDFLLKFLSKQKDIQQLMVSLARLSPIAVV